MNSNSFIRVQKKRKFFFEFKFKFGKMIEFKCEFAALVVSAPVSGAGDSGLIRIRSRVKPMTLKLAFTVACSALKGQCLEKPTS